jgi:hypothetical protein
MTRRHDSIVTFGVVLACAGAVAAVFGFEMLIGFVTGVIVTILAAVLAGIDFE